MSAGKGSGLRPSQVSKEEFSNHWDKTFGKKDREKAQATPMVIEKEFNGKFTSLGELRQLINEMETMPNSTKIHTQVVGIDDGNAWYMDASLTRAPGFNLGLILTITHPQLKVLPVITDN